MSDIAIRADDLSKQYRIGAHVAGRVELGDAELARVVGREGAEVRLELRRVEVRVRRAAAFRTPRARGS